MVDWKVERIDRVRGRQGLATCSLPGLNKDGCGVVNRKHAAIIRHVERLIFPHTLLAQVAQHAERILLQVGWWERVM